MNRFTCEVCQKSFTRSSALKRHIGAVHGAGYLCDKCGEQFKKVNTLHKHMQTVHENSSRNMNQSGNSNFSSKYGESSRKKELRDSGRVVSSNDLISASSSTSNNSCLKFCSECNLHIDPQKWKFHMRTNAHKRNAAAPVSDKLKVVKSALKERIESVVYENKDEWLLDCKEFFESSKEIILSTLVSMLEKHVSYKYNVELFCEYVKMLKKSDNEDDDLEISIKSFQTKMSTILNKDDLTSSYELKTGCIATKMEEFQEKDSGWSLIKICHLEININRYKPLKGSQYLSLPQDIEKKHACVNIKNIDFYCFKWAIISALCPEQSNISRPSSYSIDDISASSIILKNSIKLKFGQLSFPLRVEDVKYFEEMNQFVSVNVFGIENMEKSTHKIVGPFYCTKSEKTIHINLLLIQNEEEEKSHYVWIKHMSRYYPFYFIIRNFFKNFFLQINSQSTDFKKK